MATEIAAPREAVWQAIVRPEHEVRWRPGALERLPDGQVGGRTSHRYRLLLHQVPVVLERTRQAEASGERLRSELRLGLFRLEETFTLSPGGARHTRLGIKVRAGSRMPLVGGSLDRFDVRQFATDMAGITLQAVRDWCERDGTRPVAPEPSLADVRS